MTYDYDVMGFYARVTLVTHSISKRKREEYYIRGRNGPVFSFPTQPSKFLPRYYFQYKQDIFLIYKRYSYIFGKSTEDKVYSLKPNRTRRELNTYRTIRERDERKSLRKRQVTP